MTKLQILRNQSREFHKFFWAINCCSSNTHGFHEIFAFFRETFRSLETLVPAMLAILAVRGAPGAVPRVSAMLAIIAVWAAPGAVPRVSCVSWKSQLSYVFCSYFYHRCVQSCSAMSGVSVLRVIWFCWWFHNEWRLRSQNPLVLLVVQQQVCEELFHNERRVRSRNPGIPRGPCCFISPVSLLREPAREYRASSDASWFVVGLAGLAVEIDQCRYTSVDRPVEIDQCR